MVAYNSTHRVTHRVRLNLDPYLIFVLVEVVQPIGLGRLLVFEEVHLLISLSLKPTFEAVQRRSINVLL